MDYINNNFTKISLDEESLKIRGETLDNFKCGDYYLESTISDQSSNQLKIIKNGFIAGDYYYRLNGSNEFIQNNQQVIKDSLKYMKSIYICPKCGNNNIFKEKIMGNDTGDKICSICKYIGTKEEFKI
jgi:predicted RNA-binding Zn-ribbon protein involved in translation (DUF1610 family)